MRGEQAANPADGGPRQAGMPTPEEVARRLVAERRERLIRWVRPVERAVALFVGSLWPGVGEAAVREREEAERVARESEERRRAEAEAAEKEREEKEREKQAEGSEGKVEGAMNGKGQAAGPSGTSLAPASGEEDTGDGQVEAAEASTAST